MARLNINIV